MSALPVYSHDSGYTLEYPLAPGLRSHRLALGCMHFGRGGNPDGSLSAEDRRRAFQALETALELGWNFFDHADIYCRGQSEILFGELMREMKVSRESIILQSKCGIRFMDDPNPGDPHRFDFSKKHILCSAEGSLKRLGTDYLDVFLLHRPDLLGDPNEIVEALSLLRESGKVRHFGVSNFTPILLDLYQQAGFVPVAHQVEISLLKPSLLDATFVAAEQRPAVGHTGDGALEWNRMHGVVTQAWAPLAYGYLSGRVPSEESEIVSRTAKVVETIAHEHGTPLEAVVIAWLLRHPAMIQPIIGTREPDRLKACDQARSVKLTREQWYTLYRASHGVSFP